MMVDVLAASASTPVDVGQDIGAKEFEGVTRMLKPSKDVSTRQLAHTPFLSASFFRSSSVAAVSNSNQPVLPSTRFRNGFLAAVHVAHTDKLRLILRPEDLWLVVAQGVAAFAGYGSNAEILRRALRCGAVDGNGDGDGHGRIGMEPIIIDENSLPTRNVRNAFSPPPPPPPPPSPYTAAASGPCEGSTKSGNVDWAACAQAVAHAAGKFGLHDELRLDPPPGVSKHLPCAVQECGGRGGGGDLKDGGTKMNIADALATFLDVQAGGTASGIPSITLLGKREDWQLLMKKTRLLRGLIRGLDTWIDELSPILAEFLQVFDGHIASSFWDGIYHYAAARGRPRCVGWVLSLFPYDRNGKRGHSVMDPSVVATGSVDVAFQRNSGDDVMTFRSGFLGVYQPAPDAVRPYVGWEILCGNVVEKEKKCIEREKIYSRPPALMSRWKIPELFNLPPLQKPVPACSFLATTSLRARSSSNSSPSFSSSSSSSPSPSPSLSPCSSSFTAPRPAPLPPP